jgi:uncharacterized membrane protein YphA (DoxX/SURF4 family)
MNIRKVFSIVLRLIAAGIMLQTLYFKFTGQPESVYIFSTLGVEPWGRIGTGTAELIASVLLLVPSTVALGAAMGIGIMSGAIISHLGILGIEVQDDGGQLFMYALIVMFCCVTLLVLYSQQLKVFLSKLKK